MNLVSVELSSLFCSAYLREGMRVVVVTGASSAIGTAIANKFAATVESTTVVYATSRRRPTETLSSVTWIGGDIQTQSDEIVQRIMTDITTRMVPEDGSQAAGASTTGTPAIDLLVNAAGVGLNRLLMRSTAGDIDDVLRTNVTGTLLMTKAAISHGGMLKARNGSVIFVGSVVGNHGNIGQVAYAASKAALVGASMSLVKEYGRYGIRFNVLSPGLVAGPGMGSSLGEDIRKRWLERCALQRLATPDDVAETILALSSCKYLNGQVVELDGGRL